MSAPSSARPVSCGPGSTATRVWLTSFTSSRTCSCCVRGTSLQPGTLLPLFCPQAPVPQGPAASLQALRLRTGAPGNCSPLPPPSSPQLFQAPRPILSQSSSRFHSLIPSGHHYNLQPPPPSSQAQRAQCLASKELVPPHFAGPSVRFPKALATSLKNSGLERVVLGVCTEQ